MRPRSTASRCSAVARPDSRPGSSSPTAASRDASSRPTGRSAASRRRSSATGSASTSAAIASSRSSAPVQRLWEQTLGDEFLVRPRLSRIFYRGEYFAYPLRAEDVVAPARRESRRSRCAGSYLAARLRRGEPPRHVRGLGDRPLRPPALQRVLPRVHREGLGDPGKRDPVGVGGAADPQPLVLDRVDLRASASSGRT